MQKKVREKEKKEEVKLIGDVQDKTIIIRLLWVADRGGSESEAETRN
jgi:hypothetical protein